MDTERPDSPSPSAAVSARTAADTPRAGGEGGNGVENVGEACERKRGDSDEACPPEVGAPPAPEAGALVVIAPAPPPSAHVVFVADASSSMGSFGRGPAAGMREFLTSQRSDDTAPGVQLEVRVFSNAVTTAFCGRADRVGEEDVERCVAALASGGGTRLYDALGEALEDQDRRADARGTGRGLLVAVLTDGEDTCSATWTVRDVKDLAATFKEKGGDVVWMQANLDAVHEGAAVGVGEDQTLQVGAGAEAMMGAFRAISGATTRYCTTATRASTGPESGGWSAIPHLAFTALERCSSCPTPAQHAHLQREAEGGPYTGGWPPATQMGGIEEEDVAAGQQPCARPPCVPMVRGSAESATVGPASRW